MTHQSPAQQYLSQDAPTGWETLFRMLTWHHRVNWNAPDYIEAGEHPGGDDGRSETTELDEVEAVSSLIRETPVWASPDDQPRHALLIDLDVDAWLIPSSTSGHSHLYVDIPGGITEADLFEFLHAAAKIGLVEEGYVGACESRSMTSLRAPWIVKGHEPDPEAPRPSEPLPDGDPWKAPAVTTVVENADHVRPVF